jgi:glycosyltransferase involved in cell wall biosynthesis
MHEAGAEILLLCSPSFLMGKSTPFPKCICLPDPVEGPGGLFKKIRMVWRIVLSRYILAWIALVNLPDLILLDSYVEYMAPLWVDPHIVLSRIFGFRYAANLHDPIRNYAVGPLWWHRLSVWLAYQFLDVVFVHRELPERGIVPQRVQVVVTPHGLYDVNLDVHDRDSIRSDWGVLPGQKVFLSFGYIRDGKNLDLVIRALPRVPEVFLVVAGSVASSRDKPVIFYRNLAEELGVSERCLIFEGYLRDDETGRYFSGADFVLLTYSSSFHSQSGVLNQAAKTRRPVLASASSSPMIESVVSHSLGITVEPDSVEAIVDGMKKLMRGDIQPRWDDYEAGASWKENARRVLLQARGSGTKE